ncbi:MAG: hypothetical protein ACE5FL_16610 [Myxococcota bacterium]
MLPLLCAFAAACANAAGADRYRLADSGSHWDVAGDDRVLEAIRPRYSEFFAVILDPSKARMPDLRALRSDLEHQPVDRRNFDALNALAIAYFESNYRAEASRGDGLVYLALSQRSAKLLAVPWRAYGETDDDGLRDAILDFFEDAGTGEKLFAADTAPRLERIVASLERRENDEARRRRIRSLAAALRPPPEATGP